MYVFCCGMHRSGSTWQYLVASHLIETKKAGRRLGVMNHEEEFAAFDRSSRPAPGDWLVLKMHTPRQAFADALAAGRALGIYSYRDLRDVVFSLIQMHESTFDEFVLKKNGLPPLIESDKFWRAQPGTLIQSYAEITQQPAASVQAIAQHVQVPLAAGEAEQLAQQFSLEENKKRAETFAEERKKPRLFKKQRSFDPNTLIHWNHIQNAKNGRWRDDATPEQLQHLARLCGPWLIEHGFEKSLDWAAQGNSDAETR